MIRYATIPGILIATNCFAQSIQTDISGIDFVTDFRELRGKTVTISDCKIGGTTESFIRCETSNGSASYSLEAATMNRSDFRWALANCPTGSIRKAECQIRVRGTVSNRPTMPSLDNAVIVRP